MTTKRGRKFATGRYKTRELLCEAVWRLWARPGFGFTDIARFTKVSATTVSIIINKKEGYRDQG